LKALFLLSLLALSGCFGGEEEDLFVTATIDGALYEGSVEGGHLFSSEPAWLLLFPSDLLQGSVFGYVAGETGSWDTVFEEACETDCSWLQYQLGSATYVSSSGTISIDTWTDHEPENEFDARLGYAEGGFEGTLSCWMGCEGAAETVEITDGAFRIQVTESMDTAG
jgi:hypothetical protein